MFYEIGIAGTGRVATTLSRALKAANHTVNVVYGRDLTKAKAVAKAVDADATNSPDLSSYGCDIVLLCVRDDAIAYLVSKLNLPAGCLCCHLSGSTPMNILLRHSPHGVFYPLQSFTKDTPTSLEDTPIYLEGSDEESLRMLAQLAGSLYAIPRRANSQTRRHLHLCAVMANNFCHHILDLCRGRMEEQSLRFEDLHLLMKHTLQRAFETSTEGMQTGPAARGDEGIINKHMKLLENDPQMQKIYQAMSESIKQPRYKDVKE